MTKIFTVRDMKRSVEEKKMREEAKAEREAEATASAKAEEKKILDKYPEIGILYRENCGFSRIVSQRVYYVYSTHNRDYMENTDLSALVEMLRR